MIYKALHMHERNQVLSTVLKTLTHANNPYSCKHYFSGSDPNTMPDTVCSDNHSKINRYE